MNLLSSRNLIIRYPLVFLLLIYYIFSVFTLGNWWVHGEYGVTGDEPHYLVMADGVINHGTFEQTVPYKSEFETKKIFPAGLAPMDATPTPQNTHAVLGPNGLYNVHNIGLPLLISIPYKVGTILSDIFHRTPSFNDWGILAVKIFLILTSGLIIIGSWKATGLFTESKGIRMAVTSIICFSYPFIPGANQIYPEFLAGNILLFVIIYLFEAKILNKNDFGYRKIIFLSLAVAFLPWLQIKFVAAALIAVVGISISEWNKKSKFSYLVSPIIFLCSAILLIMYNLYAFGYASGPYEEGALVLSATSIMVLFGLHFDKFQGLFLQNLSFFVIFLYLSQFFKRFTSVFVFLLLMYAAIVVPNSMHPNWYGGWSFAGRFQWAGVLTLIPLLVYSLIELITNFPRTGRCLFSIFILFNFSVFVRFNFLNFILYNNSFGIEQSNMYPSFLALFKNILPSMYNINFAYKFLPNYTWLIIILIIFVAGFFIQKELRKRAVLLLVMSCAVLLIITAFVTPKCPPFSKVYLASTLPSRVGSVVSNNREVLPIRDLPGFITFGPYIDLQSGKYSLKINYSSTAKTGSIVGWYDVYLFNKNITFMHEAIYGTSGIEKVIESKFQLTDSVRGLETRIWFDGVSPVTVMSLTIQENI